MTTRIKIPIQLMRQEVKTDGWAFLLLIARLLSNEAWFQKSK